MWTAEVNSNVILENFSGELNKDIQTKGSFKNDYKFFCSQFGVVPCPFIKEIIHESLSACRVSNCILDSANIRMMLLSCSAIGTRISEISLHNIKMSSSNFHDFTNAMKKIYVSQVVKLDYLSFDNEDKVHMLDMFRVVLSPACRIDYISLKGNNLTDAFIMDNLQAIQSNHSLQSLNLSDNKLTEVSGAALLKLSNFHPSLRSLSISKNCCNDHFLDNVVHFICGNIANAEDEQHLKGLLRSVTDKNKGLKDINKKRKKAGLPEINEVNSPTERIVKTAKGNILINKTFLFLDISRNHYISSNALSSMISTLQMWDKTKDPKLAIRGSEGELLTLLCKEIVEVGGNHSEDNKNQNNIQFEQVKLQIIS